MTHQLTIQLTETESQILRKLAALDCRRPQEEARYLLREIFTQRDLWPSKGGEEIGKTMDHWTAQFTERELKEIEFDKLYQTEFSHGTDGHNMRIIIAKLVAIIERMERENNECLIP